MTASINMKKITALFMVVFALIFGFTFFSADIDAYAATMSKPIVTAENTAPTSVKLNWKKVKGAKKYIVYRSDKKSKGYKAVKTLTKTSYTNTKLTCGKKYYYKVVAINGKKKTNSKIITVTAKPSIVSGIEAIGDCSTIALTWNKANSVSGYEVFCVTDNKLLATTVKTDFIHEGLTLSESKQYKVRAYKTVGKKKVYGAYSSAITASTSSEHTASGAWTIVKKATCSAKGSKTNACSICNATIVQEIDIDPSKHNLVTNTTPATCTADGSTVTKCSDCNKVYSTNVIKGGHKLVSCGNGIPATCTEDGRESDIKCENCGEIITVGAVIPSREGHSYSREYSVNADGYKVTKCVNCDYEKEEAVCVIDLTNRTVSTDGIIPDLAVFSVSEKGNDNLDINPDGIFEYEIIGSATNLTIDVNADRDVDIKLAGVTITNDGRDAFDIKKKADVEDTDKDGNEITRTPEVSISAKDGTENQITVTTSGNAFENECELSFKGHGKLSVDTVSTSINSAGKINIKNLTLYIKSGNRGIDTKTDANVTNPVTGAITVVTSYYNIKVGSDANITIESNDDCIRCKNMEIPDIKVANGETASVLKLTSATGDGIQIEGNTGFTANSGDVTIVAKKYAFNCKEKKITISGTAKITTEGSGAYCKPEA